MTEPNHGLVERLRAQALDPDGTSSDILRTAAQRISELEAKCAQARTKALEEAAGVVMRVGNFGDYKREELTPDFGQPRFDMMNDIASAIRSLVGEGSGAAG